MIVLHGIWFDLTFHLWGEAAASHAPQGDGDEARRGSSVAVASEIAPHPHALAPDALHAAVGELSPDGLLASIAGESSIDLWLPAIDHLPLPSTYKSVAANDEPGGGVVDLAPFTVPTLALAPAEALDLLVSLPDPHPPVCSDSIRYWSHLAHYLMALLSRRQFVPDVDTSGEGAGGACQACWRLVVRQGIELDRLRRCAEAMPPACRAMVTTDERCLDAAALVESFLQLCADAVIRRSLAADAFFHQIHERAAREALWEVRWLSALLGEDRRIRGPGEERSAFVNHLRAWVGRLDKADADLSTRLCLVLSEPAGDGDDADEDQPCWRIDFYLQSMDAGGALHEAAEVWADHGLAPAILRRDFTSRREHLIADLTRAAEVFSPLEESLKMEAPTGIDLTALEAHTFIHDSAPLLEAHGFSVRLPQWATRAEGRLGLRLRLRPAEEGGGAGAVVSGGMGLVSLVDFEWRAAIGDTELSAEEFERLRVSQAPLVRLRDQWIHLDAEATQTAAKFLAEQRRGRMTLGQALRAASGAADLDVGLPVFGIDATLWIDQLLREASPATLERVAQPDGFNGTLRPYQRRGLDWMVFMDRVGLGACLADDMGLGKTVQLIALLLEEQSRTGRADPTLVFAPMSVVGNWQREIERFGPSLEALVHHGPQRLSGEAFVAAAENADVVLTTYALGYRDLDTLRQVPWHRVVLDEAQKIKNPAAAQTIAIRSLPSTSKIALTGTPLENHLSELWSIMEMLNPGVLGSAADFRKRFAVPIERLGDRQRAERLKGLIRPFVLRRVKSDPDVECDLPEKMEMRVFCNLTAEQAALYEQVVATTLGEVESATGIRRRGVILAALTRLKQICNHPCHFLRESGALDGRSGKCERLTEMLEEALAEGDAALVFTQFREMGKLLVRLLAERLHTEVLFLHGGTSARRRQIMIDRFQSPEGGARIFLLSLKAGGLGLNLTRANHVFHFDRWWNPAVEDQATDRAHRIGQTRRVQVHKFVCIGTIEDRIDRMLTEKMALADRIVGSGDDWLTGLPTTELRRYLTLSRDATGEM